MTTKTVEGVQVPIADTICECGHWYEEHDSGNDCCAPGCICQWFEFSEKESTSAAIADRGGDPELWPQHVKESAASVEP